VTHLRQAMLDELQRRNYAKTTVDTYLHAVEQFAKHFTRSPDRLTLDHLRTYVDCPPGSPRCGRSTMFRRSQGDAHHRAIAVSPRAELPYKTRFHELAHVVLGHTSESEAGFTDSELTPRSLREVEAEAVALVCLEALGLPGADRSRGYIQCWNQQLGAEPIPERSAQRIFKAADQILRAGVREEARS
jgi:Phage integrase, N-terminal SAM-like domain